MSSVIVEGFDVVENPESGDVASREDVLLDELELDRADRRFAGRVVAPIVKDLVGVLLGRS